MLNLTSDVLSEAVDAAVQAGGNNLRISGIQTSLSDDMQAQAISKARTLAVQDALATAQVLGKASGVKVGPIRTITDQSAPRPQPVQFRAAADGEPQLFFGPFCRARACSCGPAAASLPTHDLPRSPVCTCSGGRRGRSVFEHDL